MKKKLLFLCTGNSCRSQIAEAIAKKEIHNKVIESAGTSPDPVNPYAIKVLKDIRIDISKNISKKIEFDDINQYDLVITLCGDAKGKCPVINYPGKHIHWDIEDPAKFKGTNDQINLKFTEIRDIIYKHINLLKEEI